MHCWKRQWGWMLPLALASTSAGAAPLYTAIDLGSLANYSGAGFTRPNALNNKGHVAGWSYYQSSGVTGYDKRAFSWSGGSIMDLGVLGTGGASVAEAIGDGDQIVGGSSAAIGVGGYTTHAFLSSGSGMQDLGTLGGQVSYANGVNGLGDVVGWSNIAGDTAQHAFVRDTTGMHDLGALSGAAGSIARAINSSDWIVGQSAYPAGNEICLWRWDRAAHKVISVQEIAPGNAIAINASCAILGADARGPFVWTADRGRSSLNLDVAYGMNDAGDVVGQYDSYDAQGAYNGGAYLNDVNLNTVKPQGLPTLIAATAINNKRQITAIDSNGHAYLLSPILPAAATNLQAKLGDDGVLLTWTNHAAGLVANLVQRQIGTAEWTTIAQADASATSYTDASLAEGVTASYRIVAASAAAQADPSNVATATLALAAPSDLNAQTTSSTAIALTWTDNSAHETGYQIQRLSDGNWVNVATLSANATSYASTGLTTGKTYTYRVRATGGGGNSPFSSAASAHLIAAPTSLALQVISPKWIRLTWASPLLDSSYWVEIERRAAKGSFEPLVSVSADHYGYDDRDAAPGTAYEYHIRYSGPDGVTDWTPVAGGVTPAATPAAPNPLSGEFAGDFVVLHWTEPAYATGYRVERRAGEGNWETVADEPWFNVTDYYDNDIAPDAYYTYRVIAYNELGDSATSQPFSVATKVAKDVTETVKITRSAFRRVIGTNDYVQSVTVTNVSGKTIAGPISYILAGMAEGKDLVGAAGQTIHGAPYLNLPGELAAGQTVALTVRLHMNYGVSLTYTPRVEAGEGARL